MSRRTAVSPLRGRIDGDPRDHMIRKLREDIAAARGRRNETVIIANYLMELREKGSLMEAERVKSEEEGRIKLDASQRSIHEFKKEVENYRSKLRELTLDVRDCEEEGTDLSKALNSKTIEVEKLKKEGLILHSDNQKLANQHVRLGAHEGDTNHEIRKLAEGVRDYELRSTEISNKLVEVEGYISGLRADNDELTERLRGYENKNGGLGDEIDDKEMRLDSLERTFSERHETIKNQVEVYIELEHKNEKCIKETKHRLNLIRLEGEKEAEINASIRRVEKLIAQRSKELALVKAESQEIHAINEDTRDKNGRMSSDLGKCHDHYQNLVRENALVQEEMENILREDEAIINIIRRKRPTQTLNHYASIRSSRAEPHLSHRTYH